VLQHIRLLILDLDYLVFDCALLKVQALRNGLIALADSIPQNVRLPDAVDAEEGFRDYGFRWTRHLEIGLDEESLLNLQQAFDLNQARLIEAGVGKVFPGIREFIVSCREAGIGVALGADTSRDYLLSVTEQHQLDGFFEIALCTEEFGIGSTDEIFDEIMHHAQVNSSETLVLGTRPHFFQAAHNLDLLAIGCGWGVHQHGGLAEADLQSLTLSQLYPALQKADDLASRYS
jgi:phosphoglycolate phosphatase-like HAD superfamily hydrolase